MLKLKAMKQLNKKFSEKKCLKLKSYGEMVDLCLNALDDIKKNRTTVSLFSLAVLGSATSVILTSTILGAKGNQQEALNASQIIGTIAGSIGGTSFITRLCLSFKDNLLIKEIIHDLKNYGIWFKDQTREYPKFYIYSEDQNFRVDLLDFINEASLIAIKNKRSLTDMRIAEFEELKTQIIEKRECVPFYEIYEEFKPKEKVQNSGMEK